jgi:hypothetical protein
VRKLAAVACWVLMLPLWCRVEAGEPPIQVGDKLKVTIGPAAVKIEEKTLTTIPAGTELTAEKVQGNWVKVTVAKDGEKVTGWVHTRYLKAVKPDSPPEEKTPPPPPSKEQPPAPQEKGTPKIVTVLWGFLYPSSLKIAPGKDYTISLKDLGDGKWLLTFKKANNTKPPRLALLFDDRLAVDLSDAQKDTFAPDHGEVLLNLGGEPKGVFLCDGDARENWDKLSKSKDAPRAVSNIAPLAR